ncbi:hypothetical protein EDC04DRAFT_2647051 [Pisolithus marmoratus]|nr:hypothetical protein EDC04DRAFT_2647051 [Pisolithus marmoratus]
MGTHISRVKSIDLDMWTPEQMQSIQKWGNRRANLYWEAHLKAGHIPPDHKMESYIRSKYETRRWALDGPPPSDPSVLEDGREPSSLDNENAPRSVPSSTPSEQSAPSSTSPSRSASTHVHTLSNISAPRAASPSLTASTYTRNQPQPRELLSAAVARRTGQGQSQSQQQPQLQSQLQASTTKNDDLFSLDFHASAPPKTASSPTPAVKDVKQDILSLFSAPPSSTSVPATVTGASDAGAHPTNVPQTTSMMGLSSIGAWGVSSGWTPPVSTSGNWGGTSSASRTPAFGSGAFSAATPAAASYTIGGTFNTTDIWASPSNSTATANNIANVSSVSATNGDIFGSAGQSLLSQSRKDDAFGDLWGDFK